MVPEGVTAELDFARGSAPFMAVLTLTISDSLPEGDYTVVVSGTSGDTVRSDEITFSVTSLPEFSLDIENREQLLTTGTMTVSGVINAHNGLDLSLGGMLDVIVEPYNQALLDSAVITWGDIDANGDLAFTVTFTVPDDLPQNEYTVQLNVVTLDGGVAHAASVAFVTESSTLDGTAVAAGENTVVSGNTSLTTARIRLRWTLAPTAQATTTVRVTQPTTEPTTPKANRNPPTRCSLPVQPSVCSVSSSAWQWWSFVAETTVVGKNSATNSGTTVPQLERAWFRFNR